MVKDKKKILAKRYAKLAKDLGKLPSWSEMATAGITRAAVRHHFGDDKKKLTELARQEFATAFNQVVDETRFNGKVLGDLKKSVKGFKRFVITTAVAGADVNSDFLASIKTYCDKKEAMLLVIPADNNLADLDHDLVVNEHIVFDDLDLNDNLKICTIKIKPKQIDPLVGLNRFAQGDRSLIVGAPKQTMRTVSTSNIKLPRALMATGALTYPWYNTKKSRNQRMDYIARHDHIIGAIVVEIVDRKYFHFRQVQADDNGAFIDLGVRYKADGSTEKVKAAAFIAGDYHIGETDDVADKCWEQLCKEVETDYFILHDAFNGHSISHHEEHDIITKAQRAMRGEIALATELFHYTRGLERISKRPKKGVVITKSNHDLFLDRYLKEGRYIKDPINHLLGCKLAAAMVEGKDPLKYACEMLGFENPKVRWLSEDEDFFVAGRQCGAHGHRGPNGSRGSLRNLEQAYGLVVFGHTHTPGIWRGAINVGTTSKLKVGYNHGPSSWVLNGCHLYEDGSYQLINVINGDYRLRD